MTTHKVVIYLTGWCPYCARALNLLQSKGIEPELIDIEAQPQSRAEMIARSGRRSVPQIFIGETHVGGCDDLYALEAEGGLEPLLESGA